LMEIEDEEKRTGGFGREEQEACTSAGVGHPSGT
jgi:hypothetical protein